MGKLTYGVGFSDGPTSTDGVACPYHQRWRDMLKRCYSKSYLEKKPSYVGCSVCDEWLIFSNFKLWMMSQKWENQHLDKDIIGDGKLYSPTTCAFISQSLNQFVNKGGSDKPSGVTYIANKNRFLAQIGRRGRSGYIGVYTTFEQANLAYLNEKAKMAKSLAYEQTDSRIIKSLLTKYKEVLSSDY